MLPAGVACHVTLTGWATVCNLELRYVLLDEFVANDLLRFTGV